MSGLGAADFPAFFRAFKGYDPFRWQTMLLERVLDRGWPEAIDLPTASGKTSALVVAVFALACTAERPRTERLPRRTFFVVDRRIVVDSAHDEALRLAMLLQAGGDPVVKAVAARLRALSGTALPLLVSRLRGGTRLDLSWRLNPAQPAIITGTVDQVGSRLLFRGYGTNPATRPLDAALTGCDSLILLDEAHCSVPFLQTARAVQRYGGSRWAREPVVNPLAVTVLSATLPPGGEEPFPPRERRGWALGDAEIQKRMNAFKRARLVRVMNAPAGVDERLGGRTSSDPLVLAAADHAARLVAEGMRRVAVMVNRVASASAVETQLRAALGGAVDVALFTGRMRPIDRDVLTRRWEPDLRAGKQRGLERPVVVVATQTLEVGADFSFDALVTECASLDALRQRFGRMDRYGDLYADGDAIPGVVLARAEQLAARAEPDPIYGTALRETWKWLDEGAEGGIFDFGIAAADALLPAEDAERRRLLEPLLAPAGGAPEMLPAHVDRWAQTSLPLFPDPDVAIFLHGADRSPVPEVRIVWRADLAAGAEETWKEVVSLLPPVAAEALSVPLHHAVRWLRGHTADGEDVADVEGAASAGDTGAGPYRKRMRWLRWEGAASKVDGAPRPNDTIVVPADEAHAGRLGPLFQRIRRETAGDGRADADGDGREPAPGALDVAEEAYAEARGQRIVRLHPALIREGDAGGAAKAVMGVVREEPGGWTELRERLQETLEPYARADSRLDGRLESLRELLDEPRRRGRSKIDWYPRDAEGETVGCILRGAPGAVQTGADALRMLAPVPLQGADESFADEDDTASVGEGNAGSLDRHLRAVAAVAHRLAEGCVDVRWSSAVAEAARLHDIGKADERFQVLLRGSEAAAALAASAGEPPLAKGDVPLSPRRRARLREAVGLPDGFRHEMLSVQMAEQPGVLETGEDRDLVLHLIASHHGYARPAAPVAVERDAPAVALESPGVALSAEERGAAVPAHRIDSPIAPRFWRLVRRHGWWGLAYLEALLRLADWQASAELEEEQR